MLAFFQQFSGVNILFMYSQTVLSSIGDVVMISLIIVIANFFFTILAVWPVNSYGRKTLMVFGGFAMMAGMFGLGLGMLVSSTMLSIGSILIFVLAFEFSWAPIVWLYNAEIMADKAVSLATAINWSANLSITLACPTIKQSLDDS